MASFIDKFNASETASLLPAEPPPPDFELVAPEPQDLVPTLRLWQIHQRLGFSVSADFLRGLGIEPAGKDRAAVLYHERDFSRICDALIAQVARAKLENK